MDGFVSWLESTAVSRGIVHNRWIWPLCEIIHFIGLTLVIGIAGFFDLRLMGFMKRVPVAAARDLMPLAMAGFLLNLATGATFFIGTPAPVRGQRRVVGEDVLPAPRRAQRDVLRDDRRRTHHRPGRR